MCCTRGISTSSSESGGVAGRGMGCVAGCIGTAGRAVRQLNAPQVRPVGHEHAPHAVRGDGVHADEACSVALPVRAALLGAVPRHVLHPMGTGPNALFEQP